MAIYSFEAGRLAAETTLKVRHEPAALRHYQTVAQNRESGKLGGQAAKKQERYEVLNRLAEKNLHRLQFVSDAQALRIAGSLDAEHDRGAAAPLFQINNKPLSSNWLSEWLAAFRMRMSQSTDKE